MVVVILLRYKIDALNKGDYMKKLGFKRIKCNNSVTYNNGQYGLGSYIKGEWEVRKLDEEYSHDWLRATHLKTFYSFKDAKKYLLQMIA